MRPATVLDRMTGGRGALAMRYSMVSVIGVVITQTLLVLFVGILDREPTWSNVVAVSLCAIPVFFLNKRWVWSHDGKLSIRREVLPFWVFTLAGLGLSTAMVAISKGISDSPLMVMAANISGFGILWVAKFLFLEQVMFVKSERQQVMSQEPPAAAVVEPG